MHTHTHTHTHTHSFGHSTCTHSRHPHNQHHSTKRNEQTRCKWNDQHNTLTYSPTRATSRRSRERRRSGSASAMRRNAAGCIMPSLRFSAMAASSRSTDAKRRAAGTERRWKNLGDAHASPMHMKPVSTTRHCCAVNTPTHPHTHTPTHPHTHTHTQTCTPRAAIHSVRKSTKHHDDSNATTSSSTSSSNKKRKPVR